MNVGCSGCGTVCRVDPDKIPVAGVRARCSVCSVVFWVRRESPAAAATLTVQPQRQPSQPSRPSPPPPPPPPAAPPWPEAARAPFRSQPVGAEPLGGGFQVGVGPATPPYSAPVAEPPARPAPPPRHVNPFLAQDPTARARRLARALVSDIVVYNPAKRRDGLRDGSLRVLFAEEIRKSWEEYVDQVGQDLAESTPYFTEALNEILADGQRIF